MNGSSEAGPSGSHQHPSSTHMEDELEDSDVDDRSISTKEGPASVPRKRARTVRQTLSCFECKRRKVKCDRSAPCGQCVLRGDGPACEFQAPRPHLSTKRNPARPEESLISMGQVVRRLAHLENLYAAAFGSFPPDEGTASPVAQRRRISTSASQIDQPTPKETALQALEELATARGYGSPPPPRHQPLPPAVLVLPQRDELQSPVPTWSPTVLLPPELVATSASPGLSLARVLSPLPFSNDLIRDAMINVMPEREVADVLLHVFFTQVDPKWHVVHKPTFIAEINQGWNVSAEDRQKIDPAWRALALAVLSLAATWILETGHPLEAPLTTCEYLVAGDAPEVYFEAARLNLRLANWTARPQIRVVQTILLFGARMNSMMSPFDGSVNSGPSGDFQYGVWLASAIQIAKQLKLHLVNHDVMPKEDVSLPPFPSSLRREIALRLWHFLMALDWRLNAKDDEVILQTISYRTLPSNINDDDLSLTQHRIDSPKNIYTATTPLFYQRALGLLSLEVARTLPTPIDSVIEYYDSLVQGVGSDVTSCSPASDPGFAMIQAARNNRMIRFLLPYASNEEILWRMEANAGLVIQFLIWTDGSEPERSRLYVSYCVSAVLVLYYAMVKHANADSIDTAPILSTVSQIGTQLDSLSKSYQGSQVFRELCRVGYTIIGRLLEFERVRRPGENSTTVAEVLKGCDGRVRDGKYTIVSDEMSDMNDSGVDDWDQFMNLFRSDGVV